MADYLQILRGITGGLEAGQNFRANRQLERSREQAIESGEYDLEQRRAIRRVRDPESERVLGKLDPSTVRDYDATFGDPFAFKLLDWFKQKMGARKRKSALSGEEIDQIFAPSTGGLEEAAQSSGPLYADGGKVDEETLRRKLAASKLSEIPEPGRTDESARDFSRTLSDERARNRSAEARAYLERTDAAAARRAEEVPTFAIDAEGRKKIGAENAKFFSGLKERLLGAGEAAPPTAPTRASAIPVDRPAPAAVAPAAVAPAAVAPAAPRPSALPVSPTAPPRPATAVPAQAQPQTVDFSKIEADPKDVPNMTTDDWRAYRAKLIDAARQSGRPEAIQQVNNLVTQMQQEGFLSYGQQGLALQQAGNLKGAMAAYRAAFQYFPNGNDVEFGLIRDRQGQQQIVGFGRDEKTGKIVEGSQLVMNAEQAARLLENFSKPEAFRAWTKDWRDFEEGKRRFDAQLKNKQGDDAFRERKYTEVDKPLAQAQADSLANRGEADILRATRAQGVDPRSLQGAERTFRERLELVGLTDEGQKDYLASVMSQIKQGNPNTPDNTIIDAVMKAQRDGTLPQRLKAMGIQ